MGDSYLIEEEKERPQVVFVESARGRVVAMDSARYVGPEHSGRDVVVAASYLGLMPARLVAPYKPRGVIGHDSCVGKEGAGIAGLGYLEALGVPAATAAGTSAELGNGVDQYESGTISFVNILAEQCGVRVGMSVRDAAQLLLDTDPTDTTPGNKVRRTTVEEHPSGRAVIVTDSIVFATRADRDRNVLVTAGHTGRSAAAFLLEAAPWGFICSDGGRSKNDSGIAGLAITGAQGLPGASVDANTARIGDAFDGYECGLISACNEPARAQGLTEGMTVREAAHRLLQDRPEW